MKAITVEAKSNHEATVVLLAVLGLAAVIVYPLLKPLGQTGQAVAGVAGTADNVVKKAGDLVSGILDIPANLGRGWHFYGNNFWDGGVFFGNDSEFKTFYLRNGYVTQNAVTYPPPAPAMPQPVIIKGQRVQDPGLYWEDVQ